MNRDEKGQFLTGNTGKPVGSRNKSNIELKDRTKRLLDMSLQTFENDLQALEPKDRINVMLKLLEYQIPKLKPIESQFNLGDLSNEKIVAVFGSVIETQ